MGADTHTLESQEEGFQAWYIGIIVAVIVLASLVIVALIIFRRRRHNAKSQKEDLACISPTGSDLVFENKMYNNANKNNLAKEKCADRTSPSQVIVQCKDTPCAEPCASPTYVDMDDGGYCKIEDKLTRSSQNCQPKRTVKLADKAELNNYANFNTLRHQASQNQQETGLSTQYDLPASFHPPPQIQRSLPPLQAFTPFIISSSEAGYDVPKNQEAAKDYGSTDEEDVSQFRKKVEEKYQVPVVIKHSGESSS
uniref:Uncharacterized protein n=1 Tax=Biomphalaria glabrata TaxID=6526 RepID=A0A2C9LCB2_BIOGL